MNFINKNWFKILLLISISICMYFYYIYLQEKQVFQEEIMNKQYYSIQQQNCLNIYKVESENKDNILYWDYDGIRDICEITFNKIYPISKDVCEENYKIAIDGISVPEWKSQALAERMRCLQGIYVEEF